MIDFLASKVSIKAIGRQALLPACLLAAAVLLLVACRGNAVTTELQPQTEARLVCSQECADRGQCGTAIDGSAFILGREFEPAVDLHDRLFADNALVVVNSSAVRTLQPLQPEPLGGEPFTHLFYQVVELGTGKIGWISSWCIIP